ncbi:FUSC family protein [Flavobacterium sp. MXW15]|uniref:FUSC family protein n=1 Tax=Xanthomonas chitinilytica TaxID=2989819 RepID=A0ABT3JWI0_9XANT|nr:FUSC family protein [Xanthomonas sp. H13-6]MCW4455662.1 FUSC family protein [Flavobacterium sp. MXW15]MCW4472852.1 FUSC family protein [Xanthomonas sp. H13-6]
MPPASRTPTPPSPLSPSQVLHNLLALRRLPRPRWPFALRAGVCIALPILVGWLVGDTTAGLMAATGGFTALYGSGRPYPTRAAELAVVALGFALAVGIGNWVADTSWAVVPTMAAIAMVATWLCNALRVGPPGAYMFMLACAAGTAMPAPHIGPAHAGLLVLAAGAFAWLVHMAGALFRPRGPEKAAVAGAAGAVVGYVEATATPAEADARQQAAMALHDAWQALVSFQPMNARPDGLLARLRGLNRELHLLLAEVMAARGRDAPLPEGTLQRARTLAAQVGAPPPAGRQDAIPLGHPGALAAVAEALRPRSMSLLVIGRVGVAALLAGGIGAAFELQRAYWAVAAAVLMLHQGMDWLRMVQRSVERLLGTWAGLLLAGAVLWFQPSGLGLVLVVVALQFTIEMLVMRNYALAVVFITAAALTLASGGHPVPDLGGYLLARGVDTAVGCAVALVVYQLMAPRAAAALIPEQLLRTVDSLRQVLPYLAAGEPASDAARLARRDLMHRTFALSKAYDAAMVAGREQREAAEWLWPTIAACQRLSYRVLSTSWALERIGGDAAVDAAHSMFGDDGLARLQGALDSATRALRDGYPPVPGARLPSFLAEEMRQLLECLQRETG